MNGFDKPIVLVADDNAEILDFIADDLETSYEVITVTDGVAAWDYVRDNSVDLIVSDIMMPNMNGYEFCTKVKENVHYNHIPFIMLTAKNSLQSKIEGLEFGADAYIEKPFSPNFLTAQIASLLRNRKKIKEHYESTPTIVNSTMECSKSEKEFMRKVNHLILHNIADPNLCVDMLAEKLFMSRPTLYRKIKVFSDLSPNELINKTRLNRAEKLLRDGEFKIYEIADQLGFSTASHFTRNFQKHFGISPKEYSMKN